MSQEGGGEVEDDLSREEGRKEKYRHSVME